MAYQPAASDGATIRLKQFLGSRLSVTLLLFFGGSTGVLAVLLELTGNHIAAGVTLALGIYLVICVVVFIVLPLIVLDYLFDS